MKVLRNYSWLLLLAGAALVSCDTATLPSDVSDVQGNWELQAFEQNDGNTVTVPNPEKYTVVFNADGSTHLTVDCNVCNGSYEVEGNNLTFGSLACTLAFCGEQSLDQVYMNALGTTSSYARSGSELLLNYSGGTMRFLVRQ